MGTIYSRQIRNKLIFMSADNPCSVLFCLQQHPDWNKPVALFFLSLSFSPTDLCGCVWDVVSGLKPIPLPWACVSTHTQGASTHTHGAHALTDAVNWTLEARHISAEPSRAESSPLGAWGCQQRQSCSQRSGPAASDETPRGKVSSPSGTERRSRKSCIETKPWSKLQQTQSLYLKF